jgi:hypothetical protein
MFRPRRWLNVFCKSFVVLLSACQPSSSPLPASEKLSQEARISPAEGEERTPLQETESTRKAFLRFARPRVGWLRIRAVYRYQESRTEGSAWYWQDHNLWVTCAHLFPRERPRHLEIELWDAAGKCRTLSPPWRDDSLDVAFLRDTQEVGFALSEAPPEMGDWCFTMGAPLGLSFSFQEGYLVAERQVGRQPYYQLSVWAAPGSSGSPVLNRTGQLMGMITEVAELGSSELGIAFALPATKIQQAYERYLTFALYDTARTN